MQLSQSDKGNNKQADEGALVQLVQKLNHMHGGTITLHITQITTYPW